MEPITNLFHKKFKVILLFLIVFTLIWTGYIFGSKTNQVRDLETAALAQSSSHRPAEGNISNSIIENLSNTPIGYGRNNSSSRLYNTDTLGLSTRSYGSLFGVRSIDTDIEIRVVPVSNDILNAISDPTLQVPELVSGMYQQKPIIVDTEQYGSILITPTSTPSQVTWLSEVGGESVIFLVDFPKSQRGRDILRFDVSQSKFDFAYSVDRQQALFNHVSKIYPPDQKLTQDFQDKMLARRDANYGYNFQYTVASGTNTLGDTFTLKQYSDGSGLHGCQKFTDSEKLSEWMLVGSCEFSLNVGEETITLRNEELAALGGVPKEWLNDSEILVENNYCDGLGCDGRIVAGVYDVTNKTSKTLLEQYSPCPWIGLNVNFKDQDYILAAPEYQQSTSTLYRINSGRKFEEFFVATERSDSHCGPIKVLNENLKSELTRLVEIPFSSFSDLANTTILKPSASQEAELIFEKSSDSSFILK